MREIKINGLYRHFKGNMYKVVGIANDSETLEKIVVYVSMKDETTLWTRPLDMFLSEVDKNKYPEVEQKYRFELVPLSPRTIFLPPF